MSGDGDKLDDVQAELDASVADLRSSLDQQLDELPSGKDGPLFPAFTAGDVVSCRCGRQRKARTFRIDRAQYVEGEPGVCNPGATYSLDTLSGRAYKRLIVHERNGRFTTDDGRQCDISLAQPADPRFLLNAEAMEVYYRKRVRIIDVLDRGPKMAACGTPRYSIEARDHTGETGIYHSAMRDVGADDVGGLEPHVSSQLAQAAEHLKAARCDEQSGS